MNAKALINLPMGARFCLVLAVLVPLGCSHISSSQTQVPRITKEEVMPMLGRPDVMIVDVRSARGWQESERKILGSIREDRTDGGSAWMDKYPKDKALIFYCA